MQSKNVGNPPYFTSCVCARASCIHALRNLRNRDGKPDVDAEVAFEAIDCNVIVSPKSGQALMIGLTTFGIIEIIFRNHWIIYQTINLEDELPLQLALRTTTQLIREQSHASHVRQLRPMQSRIQNARSERTSQSIQGAKVTWGGTYRTERSQPPQQHQSGVKVVENASSERKKPSRIQKAKVTCRGTHRTEHTPHNNINPEPR
jgi:hypothetical protein